MHQKSTSKTQPFYRTPRHNLLFQFVGYIVVGGIAFGVDFTTLFLLTEFFHLHYLASATAGFLVGLIVNYLLCILAIFDFRTISNSRVEFSVFAAIGLVGLLLNNLLIYSATELCGVHYLASKGIAAAIVLMFNFTLRRQLLFSKTSTDRSIARSKQHTTFPP